MSLDADSSRHRIVLAAVLLLWLAFRAALFFGGVLSPDSFAYAQHAYNLATGQFDVTADILFYGFRFGVLLPTALAYRLFGVNDLPSALFPLLASLATLWLVYRLGAILLDRRSGILAVLLYTFFPLDLPWATLIGPDSYLPMLSAASVIFAVRAAEPTASRPRTVTFAFSSGLCAGVAFQVRESGFLLLLPVLFVLLGGTRAREDAKGLPVVLAALAGFATPLLGELLYYWIATGNPLYRFSVLAKLLDFHNAPDRGWPTELSYYPLAMVGLDLGGFAWYGFFFYLWAIGITHALIAGELVRLRLLLFWAVSLFLALEFGPASLRPYIPIVKSYHYLSPISVPVVLTGAYGLAAVFVREGGPWALWVSKPTLRQVVLGAVTLGLAATSLYGSYRVLENFRDDARPYELVAAEVRRHPERPVYVPHERWALFLNYYLHYETGVNVYGRSTTARPPRLRYVWEVPDPHSLGNAYVVVHDRYLYYGFFGNPIRRDSRLPDFIYDPPREWRVVLKERGSPDYNAVTLYETEI